MKRKTIALCEAGFHPESQAKIIDAIINKCRENDVNLLIFNPLLKIEDYPKGADASSNVVRGENEIFSLINYQMIDGLLIFGNSFRQAETVLDIYKRCHKNNIPVINVNNPSIKLDHNVTLVDSNAMEIMVEHLVKVHKLTRINFIGGYKDEQPTTDRLNAYKNVLTRYNIPVDEERIAYGNFWTDSVECVKKFLKKDVPEAIVCANDAMAIFVSDYLKSEKYRIPKDIIVTGFDGISDSFEYEPAITTVQPRFTEAGEETFNMIMALIEGKEKVEDVHIESKLIPSESCGCKTKRHSVLRFLAGKTEKKDIYSNFIQAMVKSGIYSSDAQTFDDLFEYISEPLKYFSFNSMFYCIDEELTPNSQYFFDSKESNFELPKKVIGFYPYDKIFSQGRVFPTKQLMYYDILAEEKSCVRFFSPLYYKNRNLGYFSYEVKDYLNCDFYTLKLWAFNTAEKIGSFCIKREMELLSIKDYLTGLYNRRGMEKYFEEVYNKVIPNSEYIGLICIDIDYLKSINDRFGHEAGDNAIVQSAAAIKQVFSKNSICVRTGGDEFCVLTHSAKKQNLEKQIEKLNKHLDDYNSTSDLPYKVKCSCGCFSIFSKDFSSFEEMQRIADSHLYEAKAKNHHRRSTDLPSNK